MNARWKQLFGVLLLVGTGSACVDPIELDGAYDASLLTVEGTLTDDSLPQLVRLRRSLSTANGSGTQRVEGARVEVLVDGQTPLALREQTPGDYELPAGFRAVPGSTYQLRFQLPDGTRYESTPETLPAGVPIDRLYDQFDAEAVSVYRPAQGLQFGPGNHVFLDFRDPPGTRNFYRWEWTLWEKQDICATCENGLYFVDRGCVVTNTRTVYDYFCGQRCWAIIRSRDINVLADTYSEGRNIIGRPAADVPYYNRSGALIEIRQQVITPGAFRYFKLLADQAQNTGSLADTPPASIFGNVRNVDRPDDRTVGYFTAMAVTSRRHWINRETANQARVPPLGLLNRDVQPEPPSPLRPPLAPCTPDEFRTPIQPDGWRN